MTVTTFPYASPRATFADLFAGLSADEVRESRDAARWWLRHVEAAPDAFHRDLPAMLAEVVADAERGLARRRSAPTADAVASDLDLIRERVDVAGYVARRAHVEYRRRGGDELRARCPFPDHEDRSPSFDVNEAKGVWCCRGCGRGGDIFAFVMHWDGVGFREAVGRLRWEAGLIDPAPLVRPGRRREGVIRVG